MAEAKRRRLSIVVPIYKVETYLRKCVDSLLQQDLSENEYEIILVDDGSPDGCGEICDRYASQHANIKVVHRPNGGLSAARNSGIEVAQGDYVQFVDSDDYLESNVLKALIDKAETARLDVLRFNYQNVNEQYEAFEPNKVSRPFVDYCEEPCDGLTFLTERLLEGYRFKEGILFEDTEWTPRMLMRAIRVSSMDKIVYNYLQRIGSITKSIDEMIIKNTLANKMQLVDSMKEQMKGAPDKRWFEGMIAQIALSIIDDIGIVFFDDRRHLLKEMRTKGVLPLSDYHATPSALRKIRWVNCSPELYCVMLHLKSKC